MIVWLASYPRSGNTLLRIILRQVFGASSYSIYDDPADITLDPEFSRTVGHQIHGLRAEEFVAVARASPERYFIKTHELPSDDSPAIYVVRDGRAAVTSYWHYRHDFLSMPDALERVVLGDVLGGAWSDHLFAWRPFDRPRTLMLRYEQLLAPDAATIDLIGETLKLAAIGAYSISFESLQRLNRRFFRSGSNAPNIAEMNARCPELFWLRHGAAMVAFGYATEDPFAALPAERRRRLCDELVRIHGRLGTITGSKKGARAALRVDRNSSPSGNPGLVGARLLSRMRQAVIFRRKQLIVVAYILPGKAGHFFNELCGYRNAAKLLGLICRVIVPRTCAPDLVAALHAEAVLDPLPSTDDIAAQNNLERLIAFLKAAQDLKTLWAAIEAHNPSETDLVFFTSGQPTLIAGVGIWLACRSPKQRPSAFFRFSGGEFIDRTVGQIHSPAASFCLACTDLRTRPGQERVFLLADTLQLARMLTRISGRRVFPMRLPKHLGPPTKEDSAAPTPTTVYVHLNKRSGRLVRKLAEIVHLVATTERDIRFIVKCGALSDAARAVLASELASPVQILPPQQDTADYLANFSSCTIVLLAYEPQAYAGVPSGVFVEAASFGKPVVAPAGTWMAEQIAAGYGVGTTFEEPSPESVAGAVLKALRDADNLSAAARAVAPRVRADNSSQQYIEEMMKLVRMMPDMEPRYEVGDEEIDFSNPYDSRCFLRGGWGETEDFGVWTIGRQAQLSFRFASARAVAMRAFVWPFLTPTHRQIVVRVLAAQQEIAQWTFSLDTPETNTEHWREASIAVQEPNDDGGTLDVFFAVDTPASPLAEGISADSRMLGLALHKLSFRAVS